MRLMGLDPAEWLKASALEPGRCSVSGDHIIRGDEVYVTDAPSHRGWRVLLSEYNTYQFQRVRVDAEGHHQTMRRFRLL